MQKTILPENPEELIKLFFEKFPNYADIEKSKIIDAWNLLILKTSNIKRADGSAFYLHPFRTALLVAEYGLDADSIVVAFFHNLAGIEKLSENIQLEKEIKSKFGEQVLNIIKLETKISNIRINAKTLNQADAIRNMLFAIADDIRVIIIKLAERIDFMRNAKFYEEVVQKSVAQDVLDIWAPLADRLGIKQGKNELEDLSLKYLNPDAYQQIKMIVALKQNERSEYLESAKKKLVEQALKVNIQIEISSRAKHFYSIYQKMRKRNKEADELFDLLAMRILCKTNAECYSLLGIVHNLWKPLEGRFKDYVAMPKSNGYQSLHTTVMADGRPLEIQIRTHNMNNIAEHGVASHWLYKKGSTKDKVDVNSLPLFNQLRQLCDENFSDENLFNEFKNDLLKDKIVVFTPNGDIKQLPIGSTAIDFAYAVHSKIGETISAAKADGKIIPLSQELKNTQIIEIITNPQNHPTENQLQYAKTAKAKQRIHSWLLSNRSNLITQNVSNNPKDEIVKEVHSHKRGIKKNEKLQTTHSGKIRIGGTTNFIMTIAGCCSPKYPDQIVGYVSKARGITIHKKSCHIYKRIPNIDFRSVEVDWDET